MDRFNALGRGLQIMLVAGVLLLIDTFLPWQDFDVGGIAEELGVDATFSAWRGFAGYVLGLLTILLVVWIVLRLAAVNMPLPVTDTVIAAALGVLILAFGIIKILTIIDDEATIWAYIGLILTVVIAFGAWQVVQTAGGMQTLRSEMPARPVSSQTQAPPPATTPPPPSSEPQAAPMPDEPPPSTAPPEPEAPSEPEAPYDPDARREP